ncbi:MAG: poly-A polymerase [Leptospira sp.]|nr:poly-A polymerase [Leptospira sp.]
MPIDFKNQIPEPFYSHIQTIYERVTRAGFECFLVGGSVRDLVMGITPHEYDFTTNAKPDDVKKLFPLVVETGIKHGTLTIVIDKIHYEITTYRIDKDYVDGRRPNSIEFGKSLAEDLRRRDFTMNALALDPKNYEIIDEHQGLVDIQNKKIRTIGDPVQRFGEDGLRPIRALRFASSLGFEIEPTTRNAIQKTKHITEKISIERFFDEITKSLRGRKPSIMLQLLVEEDIFSLFLKDSRFKETMQIDAVTYLDRISKENLGFQIAVFFFILCPTVGLKVLEDWLRKLKTSGQIQKDCILFYQFIHLSREMDCNQNPIDLHFILKKQILCPLKKHHGAETAYQKVGNSFWRDMEIFFGKQTSLLQSLWLGKPPLLLTDLCISGNTLAEQFPDLPKTKYGILLNQLLDLVLKDPTKNEIQILLEHSAEKINNL